MKNYAPIYMLILLFISSCACHDIGIKSGMNISSISGDNTEDISPRLSFFAGGFAEFCLSDQRWAIQPELLYSSQGAKIENSVGNGELKLDYINMPILVKAEILDNFVVLAGPQIDYLFDATEETNIFVNPAIDIKDELNQISFGASVGLEYKLETGWDLGVRYNLGISNIDDFGGDQDFGWKNNVLQIGVGFRF